MPEWIRVLVGLDLWGVFLFAAALLGFGVYSGISGRNNRLMQRLAGV